MTLKDQITELCKKRNISVRELERRAGLKERTIQHWDKSEPSATKLYAVSRVLGVPVDYLLKFYYTDMYLRELDDMKASFDNMMHSNLDISKETEIEADEIIEELSRSLKEASDVQIELIQQVLLMSDDQAASILAVIDHFFPATDQD